MIMINSLANHCKLVLEVVRMPVAKLCFDTSLHPVDIRETHRRFTSPHPKYKLFGYKQLGVALIDLRHLASPSDYVDRITGQHGGASYVSKARRRGYTLARIDRNDHIDAIHDINNSMADRQGRPMDASYREKRHYFERQPHYRYFGVLNKHGKLMAYCNVGRYGNFVTLSQLLGYRNNDGVMHLMVSDVVTLMLTELRAGHGPEFVMYDTFFGARPGLRQFKTMLGFRPYRARYSVR
jgi:hypothetical protein